MNTRGYNPRNFMNEQSVPSRYRDQHYDDIKHWNMTRMITHHAQNNNCNVNKIYAAYCA